MFNPQRKSKVSDIYMQEKIYKLHLAKMHLIERSLSPRSKREEEEQQQELYLHRLEKSKREVRERVSSDVRRENRRLLDKLVETDQRHSIDPEKELPSRKDHFNSYFSTKQERERIHKENYTLVMRMDRTGPDVPSLKQLKKEFKQSRRYKKNCRKLPSISKYEREFKKKLSSPLLDSGVHSQSKPKV